MTDEQLRAALRRIIEAAGFHESNNGYRIDIDTFHCESGMRIYVKQNVTVNADEWEAASVAILREELAKCPRCGSTEGEVLCMRCPPEKLEDIKLPGFEGVVAEFPPAAETCRTLYDICPETIDAMRYDEDLREVVGKAEAFDLSDIPEADPREVHFEEVEMWQERMDAINSIPFADVVWIKEGKRLSLTNDEIEAWRFVGLSNTSFVGFRENADDPTKSFVTST